MDTEPADAVTASLVMLVPAVRLMPPFALLTRRLLLLLSMVVPAVMVMPLPAVTLASFWMAPAEVFVALMLTELDSPVAVTAPVLVMPLFVAVMAMAPPVASTVEPLEMLLPASMVMPVAALTAALLVRVVLAFSVKVPPAVTAPVFSIVVPLFVTVSIDTAPPALTISFLIFVPAVRLMPPLLLLTVIGLSLLLSIAVLADMVIVPVPAVTLASFWISASVEVISMVVPA